MVLISRTPGNTSIEGTIPCNSSRNGNWKQRDQKKCSIRFTQPHPKMRCWVGRGKTFIRLKLSEKAEASATQLTVDETVSVGIE